MFLKAILANLLILLTAASINATLYEPTVISWKDQAENEYNLVFYDISSKALIEANCIKEFAADYSVSRMPDKITPSSEMAHFYKPKSIKTDLRVSYVLLENGMTISKGKITQQAQMLKESPVNPTNNLRRNGEQFKITTLFQFKPLPRLQQQIQKPKSIYMLMDGTIDILQLDERVFKDEPACMMVAPMSQYLLVSKQCETIPPKNVDPLGLTLHRYDEYVAENQKIQIQVDSQNSTILLALFLADDIKAKFSPIQKPSPGDLDIKVTRVASGGKSLRIIIRNLSEKLIFSKLNCLVMGVDYCDKTIILQAKEEIIQRVIVHNFHKKITLLVEGANHNFEYQLKATKIEDNLLPAVNPEQKFTKNKKVKISKKAILISAICCGIFAFMIIAIFIVKKRRGRRMNQKESKSYIEKQMEEDKKCAMKRKKQSLQNLDLSTCKSTNSEISSIDASIRTCKGLFDSQTPETPPSKKIQYFIKEGQKQKQKDPEEIIDPSLETSFCKQFRLRSEQENSQNLQSHETGKRIIDSKRNQIINPSVSQFHEFTLGDNDEDQDQESNETRISQNLTGKNTGRFRTSEANHDEEVIELPQRYFLSRKQLRKIQQKEKNCLETHRARKC